VFLLLAVGAYLLATAGIAPTPAPEDETDEARIVRLFGGVVPGDVTRVLINEPGGVLVLEYELAISNVDVALDQAARGICAIRDDAALAGYAYQISAMIDLVDSLGNESVDDGVTVNVSPDVVGAMNCDDPAVIRLEDVADVSIHPVMQ
jgi:hypothetical protein